MIDQTIIDDDGDDDDHMHIISCRGCFHLQQMPISNISETTNDDDDNDDKHDDYCSDDHLFPLQHMPISETTGMISIMSYSDRTDLLEVRMLR